MYNSKRLNLFKEILYITLIALVGCAGIVFTVLYIDTFNDGFWYEYSSVITAVSVSIISVLTVFTITFFGKEKSFVFKLLFLFVSFLSVTTIFMYIIKITGLLDKVDTVEDFRKFISGFGAYAVLLFILIQFLQVVVLPIPSFVTVGAGVLLFGPFLGSIYSCVGIIIGSLFAFVLGRVFGVKIARWLIGEDTLKKWLNKIKGKDKLVLTFMFLFPFFPDDVLCFVCGVTSMSSIFFVVMIFIVRIITVFVSSYSMNNSLIPYDTWWGILLWIAFFIGVLTASYLIYKKGDVLEKLLKRKTKNIKKKHNDI